MTAAPVLPPARPRVPLTPVLSGASWRAAGAARRGPRPPSVLDAGAVRLVSSGRIALALALRELGVAAGDGVLLPAYHSLSMVPPVLWRGAVPHFYRVDGRARADLRDIAALCDADAGIKVLVATHYFGFPQDLNALRALCDARGLALVEDCAHALFGAHAGRPLGSVGDYAIASSMKFLPIYEGGCLVSSRHPLDAIRLRSAGKGFEAKAMLATLEHSFAYGRLPALRALLAPPLWLKERLWRRIKARRQVAGQPVAALAPGSSDSDASFDARWLDKRSSWFSRLLLRRLSARRIVALRRHNYARLQQALQAVPGCRPLFDTLPDGVCPWLFPLWVDDADAAFARVRQAGLPVVRFAETLWSGMDPARCPDSVRLSRQVLSFPCHQELDKAELEWMIARLAEVLCP